MNSAALRAGVEPGRLSDNQLKPNVNATGSPRDKVGVRSGNSCGSRFIFPSMSGVASNIPVFNMIFVFN